MGTYDESNNIMCLRKDLDFIFDNRRFVFVPKESFSSEGTCWIVDAMNYSKDLMTYHNLPLHDISGIPRAYLFARFAWTVFPQLETFLMRVWNDYWFQQFHQMNPFLLTEEMQEVFAAKDEVRESKSHQASSPIRRRREAAGRQTISILQWRGSRIRQTSSILINGFRFKHSIIRRIFTWITWAWFTRIHPKWSRLYEHVYLNFKKRNATLIQLSDGVQKWSVWLFYGKRKKVFTFCLSFDYFLWIQEFWVYKQVLCFFFFFPLTLNLCSLSDIYFFQPQYFFYQPRYLFLPTTIFMSSNHDIFSSNQNAYSMSSSLSPSALPTLSRGKSSTPLIIPPRF